MARHLRSKYETIRSFSRFCQGLEIPSSPLEIFLEISNVCDLRCAMCVGFSALDPFRQEFLAHQPRGFLNIAEVSRSMGELLAGTLLVHCSGDGEPTIHPNFKEFISFVSEYELLVNFITNGMHIDEAMGEFLVAQNVHTLMISLSGTTKYDYENVYLGGDFDRVLAGIRNIAQAKSYAGKRYPIIQINSLAFRHQVAQFDRFVELMADAGANVIHLKKLLSFDRMPELFEHVSIMRPWVEGRIIERALEIGRQRGVYVDCGQYARDQVHSAKEYEDRLQEIKRDADQRLPKERFGGNEISQFPGIIRPQAQGIYASRDAKLVNIDASEDDARQELRVGRLPGFEEAPFHCMEPFKTLYVRRDGAVKQCSVGNNLPFIGAIATQSGREIWTGAGLRTIRNAIVAGEYPQDLCGYCIAQRIGPNRHGADELVPDFLKWYSAVRRPRH
jgi:MoaA/NifB/PqqE/SkfB family radical SAM enzyme